MSSLKDFDSEKAPVSAHVVSSDLEETEQVEVFKHGENGVDFRTMGWIRTGIVFLKLTFAAGVLGIPFAFATLGAVGGSFMIIIWGVINPYCGAIQADFRNKHRQVHTAADMGFILYGNIGREIVGGAYLFTWIICSGINILGLSIAFNALSGGTAMCSVWWTFIAYIIVSGLASIRKLHNTGAIMLIGFISILSAIMLVVIAVAVQSRPALAPATGPYDREYHVWAPAGTTFAAGFSACLAIYASSSATMGFIPIMAEMKNPLHIKRSIALSMSFLGTSYMAIANVIYYYAGQYVASPALGSAGPKIKKIAFGIGLPGIIAGSMICVHLAAKYLFVRLLRDSPHLQSNSKTHWVTWLSCTFGLGAIAFVLASAVPFFNDLVALVGAIGFAPLALVMPAVLWFHMNPAAHRGTLAQKGAALLHAVLFVMGLIVVFAGTYSVVVTIVNSYKRHEFGSAFSCADNSNTVANTR